MKNRQLIKLLSILFLGVFVISLSGCVVMVKHPPRPAIRVEVQPARPGLRAVWVKGHWKWKGHHRRGRWVWIPGHWRRHF